jgi:hypothetical protein
MILDGAELLEVLKRTSNAIELRNENGWRYRTISAEEALQLDLDLFVGIGNLRRIRFLRRRHQKFTINAGSRTTQRLKGEAARNIAHPLIQEHRRVE